MCVCVCERERERERERKIKQEAGSRDERSDGTREGELKLRVWEKTMEVCEEQQREESCLWSLW